MTNIKETGLRNLKARQKFFEDLKNKQGYTKPGSENYRKH